MVKFLISITCEGNFQFKEGELHEYTEDLDNNENKEYILVKQPNSPKNKNWYCKIARKLEGQIFEFVD